LLGFARDVARGVLRAPDGRGGELFPEVARVGAEERTGFVRLTDSGRVARVGVLVRSPTLDRFVFGRSELFLVELDASVLGSTRIRSRVVGLRSGVSSTMRVVRTGSIEGRRLISCRAFSRVVGVRFGSSSTMRVVRTGSIEGRVRLLFSSAGGGFQPSGILVSLSR